MHMDEEIKKHVEDTEKLNAEADETHPRVGLFYVVDGKVFLQSIAAGSLRSPGRTVSFNLSHVMYWDEIVRNERPDLKKVFWTFIPEEG